MQTDAPAAQAIAIDHIVRPDPVDSASTPVPPNDPKPRRLRLFDRLTDRSRRVRLFTTVWLIGSVIVSALFAFRVFPAIYEDRTSTVVEIHFQAHVPVDGGRLAQIYYPNTPTFIDRFGQFRADSAFLYFSACDALPLSQRPICDTSRNWKKLDPRLMECQDALACDLGTYRMGEEQRYVILSGINPAEGASVDIDDLQRPSFSDPGGWGKNATWPLFFICMFLALKLGRSLGEFLFTPYEK